MHQPSAETVARVISIASHVSTGVAYAPEHSPFTTVFVDLTHRCNMACRNCYIPNRDIPDLDPEWLYSILRRLPRRTRIRLVGAEPTMRRDLPQIIAEVRRLRHLPAIMTNGLKLKRAEYVRTLKSAGLRTVYLSMNGGLDDDLYLAIDGLRCAADKRAALDNLCSERVFVTLGMILVRDVNAHHLRDFWKHIAVRQQAREIHLRSVGRMGRYMETPAFNLGEMFEIVLDALGTTDCGIRIEYRDARNCDFWFAGRKFVITQWPDLGSKWRGRLTPGGTLEPCFEHVIANAAQGGY